MSRSLIPAIAAAAISLATLPTHAAGPAKYTLRYKFAMGEVLRYHVRHDTNMRTTMEDTTQRLETHTDSVKAWKVTDVLPSGEMEFIHLVESVKMSNHEVGQPANKYDSTVDKTPPRGFESVAAATGVPLLVVRITPEGIVTGREEKHGSMPASPDMPITLELPKQPVAVGERWSHNYDVPATKQSGAKMQVRTRRVCKLRQVKSGVATIDVEYQILTPVEPFVVASLKERLTKGTVRFDIARGRIIHQQHNVDKRILGFAGEDKPSSLHFVARQQERLLDDGQQVAQAPAGVKQASATSPR
jgi:hypothetical protein